MDVDYNPENGKVGEGNDAIFKLKIYDFQIFSTTKENDSFQPLNFLVSTLRCQLNE
jgi:hypothetical protein